jgi:hypothetical protein
MRKMGKEHGWCFGGEYYGRYLQDILNGEELYFVQLNGMPVAVHVIRLEGDDTRNRKRYEDELGFFSVQEAKYPQNDDAIYDIEDFLKKNGTKIAKSNRVSRSRSRRNRRSRPGAKSNPDTYDPETEYILALASVNHAARATMEKQSSSRTQIDRAITSLRSSLQKTKRRKNDRYSFRGEAKTVAKWASANLKSAEARDEFRKQLVTHLESNRQVIRGIQGLPADQREDVLLTLLARSGDAEPTTYSELMIEIRPAPEYLGKKKLRAQARSIRKQEEAARLLGYTALQFEAEGELAKWVCAASPDPEACAFLEIDTGSWQGPDLYVKEPLWWYDLGIMPSGRAEEIRSRLGAEWVYTANKYNAKRFFTDVAYHPDLALGWMESRKPSRKAVEKSLRKLVESQPRKHDFTDRRAPKWVKRLNGRHVTDDIDLSRVGKHHGWCFGGGHAARYLEKIVQGQELYFLQLKRDGPLVAVHIERTGINMVDPPEYEDENGPFNLIEAKYPQNAEAMPDMRKALGKLLRRRKRQQHRRGR